MQYCPAKVRKILQNEWHCPAYTNTRVGKYDINIINTPIILLHYASCLSSVIVGVLYDFFHGPDVPFIESFHATGIFEDQQ